MDSNYDYHLSLNKDYHLIKSEFMTENPTVTGAIDFHFSFCVVFSDWILRGSDNSSEEEEPERIRQRDEHVVNHVVSVSRQQFWCSEKTKRFVDEELVRVFPVEEDQDRFIKGLVDFAWEEARRSVMSNPACYSVLNLQIHAVLELQHIFLPDEIDYINPSSESSIEGLETVAADDSCQSDLEMDCNCSICLEDFSEEVLISMPVCSHTFHGDCIKTWLTTSHYCPLCRIETPLEYELDE